ncbi:immunoglobulin domain-containing protein [Pedosphaera parvula]|uniref:Immunoglobulin I-set domain protein n=1 Tax=Pedosphaera parvula (strain Ellin514) TaxID=320771 RepID=B9XPX8_PEDPL|nr:immunoglobulin domain-containing protein [Pedosphaera parvula]EEF58075.1 Immunoglobulin I-set domain protein [Pedosphaera parvula Ellin514]
MKKILSAVLLSALTIGAVKADLIWNEGFNYPDGGITTNSAGVWIRQNGSGNDSLVNNHKLEVSATGGVPISRSDDVHRNLSDPYTNTTVIFASFTVNVTSLPNAAGGYFAHFENGSSTFYGRIFALTGTPGPNSTNFTALPGTYRIGVSASSNAPNQIFPIDLATNTDYQVVVSYNTADSYAQLWVNPLSFSDTSVSTGDPVKTQVYLQSFGFRQASSFGNFFCSVSNLATATTFDEAATNVWSLTPVAPVILYQPKNVTNFTGNPATLSVVANGQGLAGLNYQWQKGGVNISNPAGNANTFTISSLALTDSGFYTVVVSNPTTGLSVTSAAAYISANNNPIPPVISQQPTNLTVYYGQTANFSVNANGAQPITYQWLYNNSPIGGATDATLSILNVNTNNGTTGTYKVDITNPYGTTHSASATLAAIGAPVVTIGYLHTLVDGTFYLPTNTTALYTVTGTVTSYTNMTTPGNSEFFIQDGTGGIAVFFAGNGTTIPQAGDSVTVTGPLGQFNSLLEMNLSASDPSHIVVTNSSGHPITSVVLPFSFTNSVAYGGISNAVRLYECAVVTYTNVYFPAGFTNGTFASGVNYTITNAAGETGVFRVDSRVGNIIGQPIPTFAWTVTGPMSYFLTATASDRSAGYELLATRLEDIVTNTPAAIGVTDAQSGTNNVLSWVTQPGYVYSVLQSANVAGPYTRVATTYATGAAGSYVSTNAVTGSKFFQIVSP